MRDMHNTIHVARAISPVVVTDNTAQVGEIIDRQGYDAVEFLVATGTLADADATFAVLIEEGDDSGLSDAAAVTDAGLLGTEGLAGFQFDDDDEVRKALKEPPKDTRARLRSYYIKLNTSLSRKFIQASWDKVVMVHSSKAISLADPFSYRIPTD